MDKKERTKNLISIVVPVFNKVKMTLECLNSIKKYSAEKNIEVIVVNNGSNYITGTILNTYTFLNKRFQIAKLDENLNFSVGCNYGFSVSNGEYIIFLNNDTIVTENWLDSILMHLKNNEIGMVQSLLLYPDKTIQCGGVDFGDDGFGFSRRKGECFSSMDKPEDCKALTAACLAVRASDFIKLRGFETWYVNGQEDVDFCLRFSQIWPQKKKIVDPSSVVFHFESQTFGRKDKITPNRKIFSFYWNTYKAR